MTQRWVILGVAVAAQAAMSALVYGPPFLLPMIQAEERISLPGASLLVAAPMLGMLLTMILWGALADRFGERVVMTVGMLGSAAAGFAAAVVPGLVGLGVALAVAGLFSASISAASGRAVLGWFDVRERGLAMGIRQTCTPIGVGIAAVSLPLAAGAGGYRVALVVPSALCLLAGIAVAALLRNPPRSGTREVGATGSPYRQARLWRVHAASALLVGPQFIASTFALQYLESEQGWDPVAAGAVIAVVNIIGAGARIVAGIWSDRAGSRMRPMRAIAALAALSLLVWALGDAVAGWLALVGLTATLVVSVMDNGLGFTASAELAGPSWAGRAIGVQNTGQGVVGLAVVPVFAVVVTALPWPWALALAAAMPIAAAAATPVRGEVLGRPVPART
ncbi:MFS transporter [Actinokineospora sp. UTMC 2448]|uniref:MFS transporter n=1 Tax=Actinokineospora sp. UTMC 2448 TaxID=2268449 RepID=UPI002164AE3C|nr:MFS transporter [Actinokineospora sp. UTMC 2448]UVS82504.1 putative sulfoacetate transporter SauU [Actinokineospora sp. UTMC 2448]